MTLLLLGGPFPSLANRFGLRRSQLLFHFGCCRLQTFTTEATGELASVICIDMGVVLSLRDGYVGEAVVDQQLAFLGVHVDLALDSLFDPGCCGRSLRNRRTHRPGPAKFSPFADRKNDSQSVGFSLNGTHLGLAKLHVTHSKSRNRPCEWACKSQQLVYLELLGGEGGIRIYSKS